MVVGANGVADARGLLGPDGVADGFAADAQPTKSSDAQAAILRLARHAAA